MVLGLKKSKREVKVPLDYTICIQDIKPWPPSHEFRDVHTIVIQWENGGHKCSTEPVKPSLTKSKIEFNSQFDISITFSKDPSIKGSAANRFQKKLLDFTVCEIRRDRPGMKVIGTTSIDMAEYGVLKDAVDVMLPINCRKARRNTLQPLLYLKMQPSGKDHERSLSRGSPREMELENDSKEMVSTLMSDGYEDEAVIDGFTNDDLDIHSSSTNLCPSPKAPIIEIQESTDEINESRLESAAEAKSDAMSQEPDSERETALASVLRDSTSYRIETLDRFSLNKGYGIMDNDTSSSFTNSPPTSPEVNDTRFDSCMDSSFSAVSSATVEEADIPSVSSRRENTDADNVGGLKNRNGPLDNLENKGIKLRITTEPKVYVLQDEKPNENGDALTEIVSGYRFESLQQPAYVHNKFEMSLGSTRSSWKVNAENGDEKFTNSIRPISDTSETPKKDRYMEEVKDNGAQDVKQNDATGFVSASSSVLNNRIQELERRVEMLEDELREVASVEIGLYSVVAEHGSSVQKVHTPARRISRLYIHASRNRSGERRARAARNAISGLVLVAKACGNDVPRLTFWLSNYVMLRTIITQAMNGTKEVTPEQHSCSKSDSRIHKGEEHDWEDPFMFTAALEGIESLIFSRIVESIWWQAFAPHMQSVDKDCEPKHAHKRTPCFDLQQANTSIEIWKKAIKDACGRLCPVRAEGHKCGCLPILDRLVMEQCVARLDVAMFNAILRESSDEMPTDPVSDPISDSKVLPVPPGKLSFGAGAQLKNAVGNWSRWLTDLIGMDTDDDSCRAGMIDDAGCYSGGRVKPFCFLNALSDLLMLPKDMLFDSSMRKEVCPVFSTAIIRRILRCFEADDFCPVAVPNTLLQALDSEDHRDEKGDEPVTSSLCLASPITYYPPMMTSMETVNRDSSLATSFKSHTSDDELEELSHPLASMPGYKFTSSSAKLKERSAERYRLLLEVWRDGE